MLPEYQEKNPAVDLKGQLLLEGRCYPPFGRHRVSTGAYYSLLRFYYPRQKTL